jgi:hypothetical protein
MSGSIDVNNGKEFDEDENYDTINPRHGLSTLLKTLNKNRKNELSSLLKTLNEKTCGIAAINQPECNQIYDSQLFYECFFKLKNLTIRTTPTNEELRLFSEANFQHLVTNMLIYYKSIFLELDFKADDAYSNELNEQASVNERRVSTFSHMLFILNQLLFKLVTFNLRFLNEKSALAALFEFVLDEKVFQHLYDGDLKLLSALINSLKSLSLFSNCNQKLKMSWLNSKIAARFVVIAQNIKTFKIMRQIYMILAQVFIIIIIIIIIIFILKTFKIINSSKNK